MFENDIKKVDPKERNIFIPSDSMSLHDYTAFKKIFNAKLDVENAKIVAFNENAAKYNQQLKPELVEYPLDTVTVLSPKVFVIVLVDYKKVVIPRGILELPMELVDHWYVKAQGVKPYKVVAPIEPNAVNNAPLGVDEKPNAPLGVDEKPKIAAFGKKKGH